MCLLSKWHFTMKTHLSKRFQDIRHNNECRIPVITFAVVVSALLQLLLPRKCFYYTARIISWIWSELRKLGSFLLARVQCPGPAAIRNTWQFHFGSDCSGDHKLLLLARRKFLYGNFCASYRQSGLTSCSELPIANITTMYNSVNFWCHAKSWGAILQQMFKSFTALKRVVVFQFN